MDHRGKGHLGVEFVHPKNGPTTQWFTNERVWLEAYQNYSRDQRYTKVKKVKKD